MASADTQYRQGDVLLVAVAALPGEAEPVAFATEPLALATSTAGLGSHHLTSSPALRAYRRRGGDAAIEWLVLTGGEVALGHPEHAPIVLGPGIWRVIRQCEYDPATGPRRIAD